MNTTCQCGSNLNAQKCCLPIIEGKTEAITAEQLMRSRYTAFTLANANYLMKSHHPKTRPIKDKKNIKRWAQSVQWQSLTITSTQKGTATDTEGIVTFKAVFIEEGKLADISETSYFEKVNNKWVYVKGTHQA